MNEGSTAIRPNCQSPTEHLVQVFLEIHGELLKALIHLLGSAEDAQDVTQEVFLKCWRTRHRIAEVRDLRAWIFRVALNAARDLQRNVWRQRRQTLSDQTPLCSRAGTSPTQNLLEREEVQHLAQALQRLQPAEREIFLLRQNSDLTYDQIARQRSLPTGTVKTLMRTACRKLRASLVAS